MIAHISEDGLKREESTAEHTDKTKHLCDKKGKRCEISQIMVLCAILHDLGKNKQIFEDYLRADENTRKKMRGTIAHASTGAKYIYDKYHNAKDDSTQILAELISYAVAAHHGMFDMIDIEKADVFAQKLIKVDDYEEAYNNAKRDYLNEAELDELFCNALEEFKEIRAKIENASKNRYRTKEMQDRIQMMGAEEKNKILMNIRAQQFFFLSCLQRLILSILVDADWEATSDFMVGIDTFNKTEETNPQEVFKRAKQNFEFYMQEKQSAVKKLIADGEMTDKEKQIFDARNELQEQCKRFAKNSAGIYCLPIPTGGGKTLSSLAYALEYCKEHPQTERVIYISPYISITEQNAEVFRQAIGNDDWILEHHSSVVRNEEQEDEDYRTSLTAKLDINWNEPFICTTFVQFMNVLFSDKNQSLRLMHRLINAVVIIDEVQSMPLKCVNTFNDMINFLTTVCNTDIVLCTATQPTLDQTECPIQYSEPKYMIENIKQWFEKFERVSVQIPQKSKKYTFESLKNEIVEQTQCFNSILVVLNTKSAVRKLYDLLKNQDIDVEYLTTNLCAEHRSDKITRIKENNDHLVVVSTNLIEAGVDISFECVYRSMTGLDSLAQSAGRCNRNGELPAGVVHLIELEGENIGNMEELIQRSDAARRTLYGYTKDNSNEDILMPEWMDEYYRLLYQKGELKDKMNFPIKESSNNIYELLSFGYSRINKNHIMNQAYKTAGKEYRVIDDNSFGVIVPYKKGAEIIEAIQTASDFKEIKKQIRMAQRFTVNVRGSQMERLRGLIQPVTDKIPDLYMIASPGIYRDDCGITTEWETLIF